MKRLLCLLCLLLLALTACNGMSDEEVRSAAAACRAKGGTPTPVRQADGLVSEVKCQVTEN